MRVVVYLSNSSRAHTLLSSLTYESWLCSYIAAFWQPRPFTRKRVVCFIGDGLRVSFRRDLMDRYNVNREQTRRRSGSKKSFKPHTPPALGAGRLHFIILGVCALSLNTNRVGRRHFSAPFAPNARDVCLELIFKIGLVLRFEFPLKCALWDGTRRMRVLGRRVCGCCLFL